jgi:hypothetical protein
MASEGYRIIGPDGQPSQPFDEAALLSGVRQGYIQPSTQVYDPETGSWMPARAFPRLAGAFPAAPIPPPSLGPRPDMYPGGWQGAPYGQPAPGMSASAKGAIGAAVTILILFFAFGIISAVRLAAVRKPMTSFDGHASVTVPGTWTPYQARNPHVIEYVKPFRDCGMSIVKSSSYQVSSTQLDLLTDRIEGRVLARLKSQGILTGGVAKLTVAGYEARQFEFDDSGKLTTHRFRETVISTPAGVYTLGEFAREDDTMAERPDMDTVIGSFRATGSAPALPDNSSYGASG